MGRPAEPRGSSPGVAKGGEVRLCVVALGGHAPLPKGERASVGRQFLHARRAVRAVLSLLDRGWGLVITHGNGPQVGKIVLSSELARGQAYPLPLSVAVVEAEAYAAQGHFPPGSMGPKVQAAAEFLRGGGRWALITTPAALPRALDGRGGARIVPAEERTPEAVPS